MKGKKEVKKGFLTGLFEKADKKLEQKAKKKKCCCCDDKCSK